MSDIIHLESSILSSSSNHFEEVGDTISTDKDVKVNNLIIKNQINSNHTKFSGNEESLSIQYNGGLPTTFSSSGVSVPNASISTLYYDTRVVSVNAKVDGIVDVSDKDHFTQVLDVPLNVDVSNAFSSSNLKLFTILRANNLIGLTTFSYNSNVEWNYYKDGQVTQAANTTSINVPIGKRSLTMIALHKEVVGSTTFINIYINY